MFVVAGVGRSPPPPLLLLLLCCCCICTRQSDGLRRPRHCQRVKASVRNVSAPRDEPVDASSMHSRKISNDDHVPTAR